MPIVHGAKLATNRLVQLRPRDLRAHQLRLASGANAVNRENVLGEIDAEIQNDHDFPFRMS